MPCPKNQKRHWQKFFSFISVFGLLLNSLQPFLFLMTPISSRAADSLEVKIDYNNTNNKFKIEINNKDAGVSGKLNYLLAYQTDKQTEAVTGNDIELKNDENFSKEIYAGTCSKNDCVPHKVLRGIFKTEIKDASWFKSQWFEINNGSLEVINEKDISKLDLEQDENDWLEKGVKETLTEEKICLKDDENIVDATVFDWEVNNLTKTGETKDKVRLGVRYIFPLENKVTVTFKCLPKDESLRTHLKISQIKVSELDLPNNVNLYGEYAYDITTEMIDGTFEYDITLPKPEDKEAKILYMEDKESEVKEVEEGKIEQEGDKVRAEGIDHFTIYFVQSDYTTIIVNPVYFPGDTIYLKADGLNVNKYYKFYLDPPGGGGGGGEFPINTLCHSGSGGVITDSYTLSSSAAIGDWKVKLKRSSNNTCGGLQNDDEKTFTVKQPSADLTAVKTNDVGGVIKVGETFKWTIKISNIGNADATFNNNDKIFKDDLPDKNITYANLQINTSNITGTINCNLSGANLECKAAGGSVTIPQGKYFEISLEATPSTITSFTNPKIDKKSLCKVDPEDKVKNELDEDNNECEDTVFVTSNTGDCNVCTTNKDEIDQLTLRLETDSARVIVKAGNKVIFDKNVNKGDSFDLIGDNDDGTFSSNDLFFYKDGNKVGKIHISCSKPIFTGQTTDETYAGKKDGDGVVDFTVISAHNKTKSLTCPVATSPIQISGKKFNDLNYNGVDDGEDGLGGWTIYVAQKVDEVNVPAQNMPTVPSNISLDSGKKYLLRVSGTYGAGDSITADAKYSVRSPNTYWTDSVQNYESYGPTLLDLQINNSSPNWGSYNSNHVYWLTYNGAGSAIDFRLYDFYPSNDSGSLKVQIYEVITETLTDSNGNYDLTLPGDITGDIIVAEQTQDGWTQTAPTGSNFGYCSIDLNSSNNTCNFGNAQARGWIVVEKQTKPNGSNQQFNFSGDLSGTIKDDQRIISAELAPGQYSVTEEETAGWSLTNITCNDDQSSHPSTGNLNEKKAYFGLDAGEVVKCTFTNTQSGSISGKKWEDVDGDGTWDEEENGIGGWLIEIKQNSQVMEQVTTQEDGSYSFENLLPGSYQVCEVLKSGWLNTYPADTTCYDIGLEAGGEVKGINFGNFKLGKVTVTKFHDRNQSGAKDDGEEVLDGWDINLASDSGTLTMTTASPSGQVIFENLLAGEYNLSEILIDGWTQTNIYCDNYDEDYKDGIYSLTIASGSDLNCYIGNYHEPIGMAAKSNNVYPNPITPGSTVTFTLKLKVENNNLYNVIIKDILPPDFKFNDVWSATVNGTSVSLPHPHFASPGTWQLSDLKEGDEVIITYQAKANSDIEPGLYKDLAWAVGNKQDDESSEKVLALAVDSGADDPGVVDENFVGTKIAINKDTQNYTSIDVKKEETKEEQGDVLGASTGLPATGGRIVWLIIASVFSLFGLLLITIGLKMKKLSKIFNRFLGLLLILGVYGLLSTNVFAGSLSVRLSEPKSPTRFNNFDLNFVALDYDNNPITVKCFYKKEGGVYSQFDTTKTLTAGGNAGSCKVTSSQLNQDGKTYSFYVEADNGTETALSEIVSVDFNTQGPGTPTSYSKEHSGTCEYKIKFKTADDGGKTVKVEIYRSRDTNFALDGSTRTASIPIGSNSEYAYTDNLPSGYCDDTWYYALRAFDSAGNGSGWVGDSLVTIVYTTTATTSTTTSPTTGAIPVTNITLPVTEVTSAPAVLGEKIATPEVTVTKPAGKKISQTVGQILGEATKKENRIKIIFGLLGILIVCIIGYGIFKKKENNQNPPANQEESHT
ncbi:MAG: SdrD B-like domain-containing protein [Microgenomates group bacterium]|nr:SdrD B-like domain-containing protein [Microgenomates group bacterium]